MAIVRLIIVALLDTVARGAIASVAGVAQAVILVCRGVIKSIGIAGRTHYTGAEEARITCACEGSLSVRATCFLMTIVYLEVTLIDRVTSSSTIPGKSDVTDTVGGITRAPGTCDTIAMESAKALACE